MFLVYLVRKLLPILLKSHYVAIASSAYTLPMLTSSKYNASNDHI